MCLVVREGGAARLLSIPIRLQGAASLKRLISILLGSTLASCAATDPMWSPPDTPATTDAQVIVYRYSQIGGKTGSWVPTRLEVNERAIGKLSDDSFVAFNVQAGDITLSVTDMINFHYADEDRMTLRERVGSEGTAYFRIVSVFGRGCEGVYEKADSHVIAFSTHYPRRDSPKTSCFQRVPEAVALKELESLRRGAGN